MQSAEDDQTACRGLPISAVPARLAALAPGTLLTLCGIDVGVLRTSLETAPIARRMLVLDLAGASTTTHAVGRILDDLAALALAMWPDWAVATGSAETSPIGAAWHRGATRLAANGHPPRFRRAAPRVELAQLLSVIDADGLVLIAALDAGRPGLAAAQIAALEWCAGAGASVAVLCANRPAPEPPFDRILYRALDIAQPVVDAVHRLITPPGKVPRGSAIEKRMRGAILADRELADLFEDEVTISLGPLGPTPRVDMLWRAGKIVVELDGFEHANYPLYGVDRNRDYELLVAGYLVLRLTNAEVELDLARALDKVRRVVNLRRTAA